MVNMKRIKLYIYFTAHLKFKNNKSHKNISFTYDFLNVYLLFVK